MNNDSFQDVTADITPKTVVYPGDPHFTREEIAILGKEGPFNLEKITLSNHIGTHIDFPAHVIKEGKTSSDYSLDDLILKGIVVEVSHDQKIITAGFVEGLDLPKEGCVFFKTSNSWISKQTEFTEDYVSLEAIAAEILVAKDVKIVGVDYMSVDASDAYELPVHKTLLSHDVLIVENLELKNIAAGDYQVYILPLKIRNMDGLPARVMLSRIK